MSPYELVLGGFSMGGAMAMHLAFRFVPEVAGVFALSSFLNDNSATYKVTIVNFNLSIIIPTSILTSLRVFLGIKREKTE